MSDDDVIVVGAGGGVDGGIGNDLIARSSIAETQADVWLSAVMWNWSSEQPI